MCQAPPAAVLQILSALVVKMLVHKNSIMILPSNLLTFLQDTDAFGPFSDSAATSGADPFTFSSSFTEDDAAFDSFGDFGDFQGAEDGELTPTAGSWTFTSGSSASDEWSEGSGHTDDQGKSPNDEKRRTAADGTLS